MAAVSEYKKIVFQLKAPAAKEVILTGDFILWNSKGLRMKKDTDGVWKTAVNLKPGSYEYKFLVDGAWQIDPSNSALRNNQLGSENSVKTVN